MRWLRRTLRIVVLAALLNVGTAWVGAMSAEHLGGSPTFGIDHPRWPITAPADWPATPTAGSVHRSRWRDESAYFAFGDDPLVVVRMEVNSAGWPRRAMGTWRAYGTGELPPGWRAAGPIKLVGGRKVDLPFMPLWRGFLINTAVFAAAIGFAALAVRVIRRVIRRWRGRCLGCGYALAGLPAGAGCPECGRAVSVGTSPAATVTSPPDPAS